MQRTEPERFWYAFYLSARTEKVVSKRLCNSGEEVFLPLVRTLKIWKDRKKWVDEPLLRSYVFVKVSPHEILRILQDTGVVKVISFSGQPAPIPDQQIEQLIQALDAGCEVVATHEDFSKGDRIEIISGPLKGITGTLSQIPGKYRIALQIDNLGQSVLVSIQPGAIKKIV